jgi:hypothetical protein
MHTQKIPIRITRTGQAYAGSVMGREIICKGSHAPAQADLDRDNPPAKRTKLRDV